MKGERKRMLMGGAVGSVLLLLLTPLASRFRSEIHAVRQRIDSLESQVIETDCGTMVFDTYVSNPEINKYPLADVKIPTLVISAVDDPMALHENARALAEQIPHARLLAVPDGGHLLLGHSQAVRSEVTQFLRNQMDQLPTASR